jgi:hypothetical protein
MADDDSDRRASSRSRVDADLAYQAIQAQLNAGWGDSDDDDEDNAAGGGYADDSMMADDTQEAAVNTSTMSAVSGDTLFSSPMASSFASPTPFGKMGTTPAKTPGSTSSGLTTTFRSSPVRTPAGPSSFAGFTPNPTPSQQGQSQFPVSPSTGGDLEEAPQEQQLQLITFPMNNNNKSLNSKPQDKNKTFAENEKYHTAFQLYLEQKSSIEERLVVLKEEQQHLDEHAMVVVGGENDIPGEQERTQLRDQKCDIELQFMQQMSEMCADRESDRAKHNFDDSESAAANNNNNKEYDVWTLLTELFQNHGIEGLLLDSDNHGSSSSNVQAAWRSAPSDFFQIEIFPAQMVHKALTLPAVTTNSKSTFGKTIFTLQRRYTVLQWLEHIYSAHVPSDAATLPPYHKNTMWPHTLGLGGANHRQSQTTQTLTIDRPSSVLHPLDGKDDAELLRGILVYIHSGQMPDAKDLCMEAGQPWRAATLSGGQYHGLQRADTDKEEGDDDNEDDDSNNAMEEEKKDVEAGAVMVETGNPQRRQWKKQCQLIAQSLEKVLQQAERSGSATASPAVTYEAALYAILARDVPRAVSNPFLRNWTSTLWMYMSALVDGTCDSLLETQALMRNTKGKRYPYPGTTEVFGESSLNDYADSLQSLKSEEVVLNAMATSPYDAVKQEATLDPYRLCASSILIGKQAVLQYIVDYVAPRCQAQVPNQQQLSPETLRFAAHFVLLIQCSYGGEFSTILSSSSQDETIEQNMMLIVQRYIESMISQRHLPLVALYTSLLPFDALVETYVKFLSVIHNEEDRRTTLDQAREQFDLGVDRIILRKVVRNALDTTG